MKHKGYQSGPITFDEHAGIFHGEVYGLRSVITFQASDAEGLKQAFVDSVDDYLEWCAERGKAPEKPAPGKFILRVSPEDHRAFMVAAKSAGKSLNAWAAEELKKASST